MGNASSSSSSMGHSDSGSESDHDMDDLRDAVHSAIVGRGNSTAISAGNNSSAAGQLAMRHNIYYDVTQFVTDYDAINVFGLLFKDLKGLKYQKRYIPGVCRQGMRMNVSYLADACPQKDADTIHSTPAASHLFSHQLSAVQALCVCVVRCSPTIHHHMKSTSTPVCHTVFSSIPILVYISVSP
jgi:hypothetical protein